MKSIILALSMLALLSLPAIAQAGAQAYKIGDGDVLSVSVWGNPELNVSVPVRPDGKISVPLVGDIGAAGATTDQLRALLEKKYAAYVKNPVVSVIVTNINSFVVYVFGGGAVQPSGGGKGGSNKPSGAITLKRNTTLLQLLSMMGSLSGADLTKARIIRGGKTLKVNFYKLYVGGDVSRDIQLKPGDFIYIPGNYASGIRVVGAVAKPCILPFERHMTALDAVLSAGGFTQYASKNDVLIERKDGGQIKKLRAHLGDVMDGELDKNVPLEPGDIVIVKTGIF